jgi:hypothetical protein
LKIASYAVNGIRSAARLFRAICAAYGANFCDIAAQRKAYAAEGRHSRAKSALPYTALAGDDIPKEMANEDEVNCTAF